MALDPAAQTVLELIRSFDGPPIHEQTPEQVRAQWAALGNLRGDGPEVASVESIVLAGVPTRVVTPHGTAPMPVLLWIHGGGWVIGSADESLALCRDLATRTGCLVVSVDYRLAPETPFPGAVDDCVAVAEWVLEHATDLGGDPERVAIGGDSAGGNLSAVVAQAVDGFVHQLLVYPATDLTMSHPSVDENGEGYLLEQATLRWFVDHYLGAGDPRDHRASPLFAPDDHLLDLPPATVLTAEFDPLRDEGRAYAERLAEAGIPVTYLCFDGQIHGFFSMPSIMPAADVALEQAAEALRRAFTT